MGKLKKKKDKLYGPVSVISILIIIVAILSLIFSILGIEGYKTVVSNGSMETTLVTVKNVISLDGLRFIIGKSVENFTGFQPLVLLIIALFGISICEQSGFLNALFSPLKRVKINIILFITILLGMISTIIGDYSYIFLIPLIGVMYKYLGKNPILGIITVFLGITLGYGTGVFFNYNDYLLGNLTEIAAKVDVDKSYAYSLFSNLYIMLVSTFIFTYLITLIIDKFLVQKLTKKYTVEEEELEISKSAKVKTLLIGLILIGITIYMVLPINLPGAGILLDHDAVRYMDKLLGNDSPFGNGLVVILTIILIVCGFVYGKLSKNIKNSHEFSLSLSKNFENLGFLFVLMFFIAELNAIIEWSNIGNVIGTKLIDLMGNLQLSGIPLIITFFIVVVFMSIFIPSTIKKWDLASPVIVPLFMRSNITPNFTQFIFKIADGVGKAFTPVYVYYIIMLAFLEKYRVDENNQVSVFGILKIMLPTIFLIMILWILFITIWYLIGIPIGIGCYPTL